VIGGVSSYVAQLAAALRPALSVRVLAYPAPLVRLESGGRRNPLRYFLHGLFILYAVAAAVRMRGRHRRLVVHSHSATFCLLVAWVGKALGATGVHTLHSPPRGPSWILRRLGPSLDGVAFVSPALRDAYIQATEIRNGHIAILPCAVSPVLPVGTGSRESRRRSIAAEIGFPPDAFVVDETITHRLEINRFLDRLTPGRFFEGSYGGLGTGLGTAGFGWTGPADWQPTAATRRAMPRARTGVFIRCSSPKFRRTA